MEAIRTDKWLKQQFPTLTARQIEEALEAGFIYLGKNPLRKKGARLTPSDTLDCSRLKEHLEKLALGNSALQLSIVHDEPSFCVVDKPAGMPSQPISLLEDQTVTHWALATFPEVRSEFPEAQPTLTPHRLDIGTSGLQIVCKTKDSFQFFREKFENHSIEKSYLAWCYGNPETDSFEITTTLCADKDASRMRVWSFECEQRPFEAKTIARVLKRDLEKGVSLIQLDAQTGVRHQIRVHLSSIGFPLVGDALYDPEYAQREFQPKHHLLRANKLSWDGKSFELKEEYTMPLKTS